MDHNFCKRTGTTRSQLGSPIRSGLVLARNGNRNCCPFAWRALNVHCSVHHSHPLSHTDKSQAAVHPGSSILETCPAVTDDQVDDTSPALDPDHCVSRPRVLRHILQSLLGHPVQTQPHGCVNVLEISESLY